VEFDSGDWRRRSSATELGLLYFLSFFMDLCAICLVEQLPSVSIQYL
jgi:hypothetical protein